MKRTENAQLLLDAIGDIREKWIADAERGRSHRRRRLYTACAAALLCIAMAVTAFAADMGNAYDLLYSAFPSLAQRLKPVQLSCVDNGIELKLISAEVDGDTARIYLGLRDLDGGRVDASTDLYDSYELRLPHDMTGHCAYTYFDEATGSACFLVEVSTTQGEKIDGEKLSFSLSCFLSDKREFSGVLPLNAADVQMKPDTQTEVNLRGGGGNPREDFEMNAFLVPGELFSPMKGVVITGMGWVDGYLHVQTHYDDLHETDAHGGVYMQGADGFILESFYAADFWDADGRGSYTEQVFDVSPEELPDMRIFGVFSSFGSRTNGDWEITVPMETLR